uniref:RAB6-interacting golgin n=1 Tax=Leersia perrieri TaxID=77586 RepID=A0A0D9XIC2_9ORYZ
MAAPPPPALEPEIGPDGIARENPVIAYTEKELENLSLEMKLTAGPKKAALEHLRKKIEISTERIRLAKVKEEQAKKAWETAAQIVKEEEDAKQKLCEDLNRLVQESAASQFSRLEELKKRLESLNPSRASVDVSGMNAAQHATINSVPQQPAAQNPQNAPSPANNADPASSGLQRPADAEKKRRPSQTGRGRGGVMILPKGRGSSGSGWTGAGFEC